MLTILFNSASQPSSLIVGYDDFRAATGLSCGWGYDSTLWTTAQAAELDRDVQEAYRWVLYPQTIPGERIPHTWSFMQQTTVLVTAISDYDYDLPTDFGSFIGQYMFWPSGSGYSPPYKTNETDILVRRQHRTGTGRPERFAIRWKSQTPGLVQRREIIFEPTPDAIYTLTYSYAVDPGKLSTTNPYPLGGSRISQLMIEACKAIGETKKNGARGDQWNLFMAELQSAIQLDKGTNTTDTVGVMRPIGGCGYTVLQDKRATTSYYYGPLTPSPETGSPSYVLEV